MPIWFWDVIREHFEVMGIEDGREYWSGQEAPTQEFILASKESLVAMEREA